MTAWWLLLPAVLAVGCKQAPVAPSAAKGLAIESWAMDPRIHPVAPEDGAVAVTNPPAMVFWHTAKAAAYTVEIARRRNFGGAIVVGGITLPFYNHTAALARGMWFWRYRYETRDGKRSVWSPVRSFRITRRSIPFPVPSVATLLSRLPDHPRIYTTKATLPAFRARKDKVAAQAFAALVARGERALAQPPQPPKLGGAMPSDPKRRGVAFWLDGGRPRQAIGVSPGTLEYASTITRDLAMLYLITGERKYADAARLRLLWQANFRIDAHQAERAHHDTVHCYEYGLQRMASAYDSIYDVLSPADRAKVLAAVEHEGGACYRKLRFKRRIHLKYQTSHAQQDMHELVTTSLAVVNDLPAAREWLEYLVPQYVNRLAWGKHDGGYSEGHYYNYKWHGMLRCALSLRNATGIDLFHKPRFRNAGRFWLYCMSLNYWWAHFGDTFSLHTPLSGSSNDRDGANFLASLYGDRTVKWWANQIDAPVQMPLWYLSDETLAEKPPVDIPQAAMFPDVGWASMYDRFYDSRSTRLFFKSSPWGSHGHSHQDENSFVVHAFGEILAIDKGYYGYCGDAYHRQVCRASKSHNTILVDGEGQGSGIQYGGRIVEFFDSASGSFVAGDATAAYGGRLSRFLRSIVFIRPHTFVVYDELAAPNPATFSWQLNAFLKMRLDEAKQTITIHSNKAALRATHLLPGGLRYRQSNERQFPLKARYNEAFPEQWTCWCETSRKAADARFLTVLDPHLAASGPAVRNVRKLDTKHLVGASFDLGGDSYTVLFQRDTARPVRAEAAGIDTDAKCVVVRRRGEDKEAVSHFVVAGTRLNVDGRALFRSRTCASADSTQPVKRAAASLSSVSLSVTDSHGSYTVPLECAADRWGRVFYFARLDPREQGRYEIAVGGPGAEVLVEDKWDPAQSTRGRRVVLREGSMLIVRSPRPLAAGSVRATLTESFKGRIVSLVRNGNFEDGVEGYVPIGWWYRHYSTGDPSYVYWSDDRPAEGSRCLKLVRVNHKARAYSQGIDITKPGRYVFRFKAKATCKGAVMNTSWSRHALTVHVEPSADWKEYRVEGNLPAHRACIHCIFDRAEGPNQVLWVDDMEFGRIAD